MSKEEKNIDLLVVSYLDKTLTETETQLLEKQLADNDNFKSDFLKGVETYRNYRQLKASETVDIEAAWEITKSKFTTPFDTVKAPKVKKLHFKKFYRITACIVVLLSLSYLLKVYVIGSKSLNNLQIPNEEITLILPNGDVQQLNLQSNKNVTTKDGVIIGRQTGAKAQFDEINAADNLQYATLKIPFGKKFNVTLSDGTEVYLNAGTTLKFPQNFSASAPLREVEVEGEAYFAVAKNAKQPFIVHTGKLNVTVLGTHFNLRTYPEEKTSEVVLAEGSVKLKSVTSQEVVLKPGDMGYYADDNKILKTKEVFVSNYTSWINGDLIYRNVTFEMILKSIERHFNVKIENHSNVLKDERLNINFGNEPLAKVLSYLHDDYGIDYTIRNNTIILK